MNEKQKIIQDLSDLTCTNLMIRLKILLKNAPPGLALGCIVRCDQRDTIEVPFVRTAGYKVKNHNTGTHRYHVSLKKNKEGHRIGLL
ncbi:MAG: hypothetical protein WCK53_05750 [Methanomicrobiales archaeon]